MTSAQQTSVVRSKENHADQLAQPHALQTATLLETCVNTWLIDVVAVGSQEDIGNLIQHVRACVDHLQG